MTQGGPAFLTSDITHWECAPQKNTNKMYSRAGGEGQAAGRCAPEPPRSPPGAAALLRHSLSPPGEGETAALAARMEPSIASCARRCVGACPPASPPAPQEGGRWEGNLLCGSVSSREAAELPWDFAWRMPEGVFKGLRCFCSRLGVVIFCLVFVSFLRLSLSGTGSALGSPWPWLVQLHRHKPPVPVSLPLVPAAPQRCQWPRLLWVHHAQVQAVPHGAWHPKPRVSRGGDSSLCPDRAPGLNDLPRVTRRIRAG